MAPYYARSSQPELRGLQWPIKRNSLYTPLTERMIKRKLEMEAATLIQRAWRTHAQALSTQIPKLTYFASRGRAELIRLTLAAGKIKYEDERISFEEFSQRKEQGKLIYGQLPVFCIDGKQYGQSYAIAKYIARLTNLLPVDPLLNLEAEALVDATDDVRRQFVPIRYMKDESENKDNVAPKKLAAYSRFYSEILPAALRNFDAILGTNRFLVAGVLTLADIAVYNLMCTVQRSNCDVMDQDEEILKMAAGCLNEFGGLKEHSRMVEGVDGIREWIEARPVTER
eukprot:TRINITY_DN8332_c0_g1_i6.p1 TRINITY_DN8332_c0_g1~~TRINITY_DN8332_c0_g1_i6.p1  ORF type:complete len:284 (+),score=59.96 TRINITY_DN8332_c0_g1_i6:173-1024(+)